MKYFRYWIEEKLQINVGAKREDITILSGSNASEDDARAKARESASKIERRINEGGQKEEYETAIREHVETIVDDANIVTVCRYGAKVLNTEAYTVLDLDDYPIDFLDMFKSLRKLPKKERIVAKFIERVGRNPEVGTDFRIYETAKGIRVIGKKYISPEDRGYIRLMRNLHVDWLYVHLSKRQKCYRARISPKPYRLKIKTIRVRSPLVCQTDEYKDWAEMYAAASGTHSVARFIKALGEDFGSDRVVKLHDQTCRAFSSLPLA